MSDGRVFNMFYGQNYGEIGAVVNHMIVEQYRMLRTLRQGAQGQTRALWLEFFYRRDFMPSVSHCSSFVLPLFIQGYSSFTYNPSFSCLNLRLRWDWGVVSVDCFPVIAGGSEQAECVDWYIFYRIRFSWRFVNIKFWEYLRRTCCLWKIKRILLELSGDLSFRV